MEKCYLVVVCIENIHYIQLTKSNNSYSLLAFENKEEAIKQFEGFSNKIDSDSYEDHVSGSLGILNLKPHIVEVDKNNPEMLREYIIENKPIKIDGQVLGAFVDMVGLKVKKEILNLSVYNISKNYILNN